MNDRLLERIVLDLQTKLNDDVITDQEFASLNQLLRENSNAREHYLRGVLLNRLLSDCVGKNDRLEAEGLGVHVDSFEVEAESDAESTASDAATLKQKNDGLPGFNSVTLFGSIILLSLVFCTIWFWIPQTEIVSRRPRIEEDVAEATTSSGGVQQTLVSYVAPTTRWGRPNDARSVGSSITLGQDHLVIEEGAVELTYASGVRVMLLAPSDFVVKEFGGELIRGGLVANVPESGHGFTIATPNGKVVDLGTEFGLAVDDFGLSDVSVFKGKVEAIPKSNNGSEGKKIEVVGGKGLQWKNGAMREYEADLRKFSSSILGTSDIGHENDFSLVDRFRGVLDSKRWKPVGDVKIVDDALVLNAGKFQETRPYLVSREKFDPLDGAVTVTCDFRFAEFDEDDAPSFSLLTRSTDERGTAFSPWNGMLGSFVCSSFGIKNETQRDVLQSSVKLGAENQLSSVAWDGFLSPEAGKQYRMKMRDDGVTVSLTICLHEDPSKKKTVTFRSLFQNKSNHIAFGGTASGSVVVDRVEILQERSTANPTNYKEFCSYLSFDPIKNQREMQLLDNLAPKDSQLCIKDDFTTQSLDSKVWQRLGDVHAENSFVSVGETEGLIDTWKARPYLLTKRKFDLKDGPITVVGKVAFANNFLSGYGATLSIVSRAGNRRGDGYQEWDNSILQDCIRSTFWPASADEKHTLEIHEKRNAAKATLLATRGVDVDPFVRNYLFRMVDNGTSVELTVIDPNKPEQEFSVRTISNSKLTSGFIGIESCWGSPVKLEGIRIYQGKVETD